MLVTPGARLGLAAAAIVVLLVTAVLLGVTPLVRYLVISRLENATGRPASVGDLEFSLFARRVVIQDLRVADAGAAAPLLTVDRVDADIHLLPLLRGRLHVVDATVRQPVVHITRTAPARFSIDDVIDHVRRKPEGDPARFFLDTLRVTGGSVVFVDTALSPPRTWTLGELTAELDDVGTLEGPAGSARGSASLAGAALSFEAGDVHLAAPRAQVTLTVRGLDLAPLDVYMPAGAKVEMARGRLNAGSTFGYAGGRLTLSGTTTIDEVVVRQEAVEISAPRLTMTADDIAFEDGRVTAGRLQGHAAPTIVDRGVTPAARFELSALHISANDIGYPGQTPAQASVVAELAAGGTVTGDGTVELDPVRVQARVSAAAIGVGQLAPYVPVAWPITVRSGEFESEVTLTYSPEPGLAVDGTFAVARPVLGRRGQREPFLTAPRLEGHVDDLVAGDLGVGVRRLRLDGASTVVDAIGSPSQRLRFTALSVDVRDADAAGRTPARVEAGARLADGATAQVTGTYQRDPGITELRAVLRDVHLSRVSGYAPPLGVDVEGRVDADLVIAHRDGQALGVSVEARVREFVLARPDDGGRLIVDPRVEITLTNLRVRPGAVAADRVTVSGAPSFVVGAGPAAEALRLDAFRLTAADLAWPGDRAVPLTVQATLSGGGNGTLSGRGDLSADGGRLDATVTIADAAAGPLAVLASIQAPVDGRLEAALRVTASFRPSVMVAVAGDATMRGLRVGDEETPPVTVAEVRAEQLSVEWPGGLAVERLLLVEPHVTIEREEDGRFPLRGMLRPAGSGDAAAGEGRAFAVAIGDLRIQDGYARFIDRTTTPFFSEEVSGLTATVRNLDTATAAPASISVQGTVGTDAALQLGGELALFGEPFSLDLSGELEGFAVPRTNPYARHFLDWIARRGSLTTKVHYRIVGDELDATNEILVERLDVEPADGDTAAGPVDERLGMPLGLIVALLKNSAGDIRLNVPVSGTVGDPQFSFADAIGTALRNTVGRLVTAPFRAIGKIFRRDGGAEEVAVDPVRFAAGSSLLTPEAERQVQRVADVLRASPHVGLVLQPIVTAADLQALGRQQIVRQVQRLQRERGLEDFAAAAAALFRERHPDRPLPDSDDAIVEALNDGASPGESQQLARRRAAATRQALTERAGVEDERLRIDAVVIRRGGEGQGGLEFALRPVGELTSPRG